MNGHAQPLRRGPAGDFDITPKLPPRIVMDHAETRPRGRDLLLALNTQGKHIFAGLDETPRQRRARIKRRRQAKHSRKVNR